MIEAGSVTDRGFKRNASRRCEHRPGHRSAACTTRCLNPSTQENTSMTLNINAPEALVQQDFSAIMKTIANAVQPLVGTGKVAAYLPILDPVPAARFGMSSEERRVGNEWFSTCRSQRAREHYKKN